MRPFFIPPLWKIPPFGKGGLGGFKQCSLSFKGGGWGILAILFLFPLLVACGQEAEESLSDVDQLVIGDMIFATPDITAASGGTVTIFNQDETPHSITSESSAGAFDNTGDFDVLVPSDGEQLLTMPTAPSGTVYFYYCRFHAGAMTPADGTITIE